MRAKSIDYCTSWRSVVVARTEENATKRRDMAPFLQGRYTTVVNDDRPQEIYPSYIYRIENGMAVGRLCPLCYWTISKFPLMYPSCRLGASSPCFFALFVFCLASITNDDSGNFRDRTDPSVPRPRQHRRLPGRDHQHAPGLTPSVLSWNVQFRV